jgi:hypothetical protein
MSWREVINLGGYLHWWASFLFMLTHSCVIFYFHVVMGDYFSYFNLIEMDLRYWFLHVWFYFVLLVHSIFFMLILLFEIIWSLDIGFVIFFCGSLQNVILNWWNLYFFHLFYNFLQEGCGNAHVSFSSHGDLFQAIGNNHFTFYSFKLFELYL